jgi:PadR family transcriptional regulator PadR
METLTRPEEQILLTIYHLKDKAYLVNIRDRLKEMTGKYLDVGTIYVPLKRLDHKGCLTTYYGEPSAVRGGKAIKFYKLTVKGYGALAEMKRIQDRLWNGVVLPHAKA